MQPLGAAQKQKPAKKAHPCRKDKADLGTRRPPDLFRMLAANRGHGRLNKTRVSDQV
jgi:hypothetical protein